MDKKKRKGCIFAICSFLFLLFVIITTTSDDTESSQTTNKDATESKESKSEKQPESSSVYNESAANTLVAYIYENTEFGKYSDLKLEVTKFDKEFCRTRVTIPDNVGETANIFGNGVCILTAKWLAENGYDLQKIFVSCYVYSPYSGVTGRKDMVKQWGRSSYVYEKDAIEWKWSNNK